MIRYVHHQLMGVAMAWCACVVSAPVAFGVRGLSAAGGEVALIVGMGSVIGSVFFGMLAASRLKWVGEISVFEEAVALNDPEALRPAEYSLRHHLPNKGLFFVLLVPSLATGLALTPWLSLIPLWLSLDWLIRAGVAARWEKKNAVLLWRGQVPNSPWELSYSPLGPPPP